MKFQLPQLCWYQNFCMWFGGTSIFDYGVRVFQHPFFPSQGQESCHPRFRTWPALCTI